MPEDQSKDVVRRDYERLLPKEEAAGAVVVGTLAWIFVLFFLMCIVSLDRANLFASAILLYRRFRIIIRASLRNEC